MLRALVTLAFLPAVGLGDIDRGIYPDLNAGVRITAPAWPVTEGAAPSDAWLRVDRQHKILTLYQGEVALTAYPLVKEPEPLAPTAGAAAEAPLQAILAALSPESAADLRGRVPASPRVEISVPSAAEDQDGDGLVNSLDVLVGAKRLCLNQAAYAANYHALKYPGGDVPRTEGVCTDTLVRALRNAGWDLQKGVHEDALKKPRLYPLEKPADANIDHRRIRMLLPWFNQYFVKVPASAPFLPGDLVLFDTFPNKAGPDHAGIVSDRLGPSGKPLVINNWTDGYVEKEMDLLGSVPVTHRFRVPSGRHPLPPLRPR
jgi:uncharacterized protein YijF (DUF1287 family)